MKRTIKVTTLIVLIGGCVLYTSLFFFHDTYRVARALTTAESNSKLKSIIFYVLQSQSLVASGSSVSNDVEVFIGEQAPIIKNAQIEVRGISRMSGSQTITVDIKQATDSFPTARARSFTLNSSGTDSNFTLRYQGDEGTGNDITSYLAGIITSPSPYTFTVKISVNGADVSMLNARLILTFQFTPPSSGNTVPNSSTSIFGAFQGRGILVNGASTSTSFGVFIGDPSPVVKSAYIQVQGVSNSTTNQSITVDIYQPPDSFPTARSQTFILNTSGKNGPFLIRYGGNGTEDLTSFFASIITAPTEYTFTIKIDASGADISLIQARLVILYQFSQATGGYFASGNIVSPTFDTFTANGAGYNTILWQGNRPIGTKVKLQVATSDSSTGPFTFIGGATCTAGDYYDLSSDEPADVQCFSNHTNKRYFRYKALLCSSADCVSPGSQTPQINDVILNWSP